MKPNEILKFWFEEIKPEQWWVKDSKLDQEIAHRFIDIHNKASLGELSHWRGDASGCLEEILILDQFSRNIYRDDPKSFAFDGMALVLAQNCIAKKLHLDLDVSHRRFLYMPYMHSESALIHEQAVELFSEKGLEGNLDFELKHKAIIDRFGRYPHRNAILGRKSTAEEIEFLSQPGSSF